MTPEEEVRALRLRLERERKAHAVAQAIGEEAIRRLYDLEEDLRALNRELEAFASTAAHDLRAPLRAIHGFAQALADDYAGQLDEEGRRLLDRISSAALRMAGLLDALAQLSRIAREDLRRQPVDLSALARSIAAELREREPARAVEFAIADGAVAEGDERLLRLVLENLLGNAWKFTRPRPRARIEFGVDPSIPAKPAFFVRDDGVGFDMARAGELFRPFRRLHPVSEFPGTGVGLATVARIVQRHGGRIWAEASPGRGAVFFFTL